MEKYHDQQSHSVDGLRTGIPEVNLQRAIESGRVDLLELALNSVPSPQDVGDATTEIGETCLHLAVKYNRPKTVRRLLQWIEERHQLAAQLINWRDVDGNTALHFSVARKHRQTLKELLGNKLVDVNALNSLHLTPLDMIYCAPCPRKIETEIKGILHSAGGLRAQDLSVHPRNVRQALVNRSHVDSTVTKGSESSTNTLLLLATLIASVTYHAVFQLPLSSSSPRRFSFNYISFPFQMEKQDAILSSYFLVCNSLAFLTSVITSISLLQRFPFKPWPQVSIASLFGSYMFSVMAKSPTQGMALLIFSLPCLMTAVLGKLYGFARQSIQDSKVMEPPIYRKPYLFC